MDPGHSIFDSADYLRTYGIDRILSVAAPGDGSDRYPPLLFHHRGDHAALLAAAIKLDAATIEYASSSLLMIPELRFIVFAGVQIDRPVRWRPAPLRFRYLNDWIVPLGDDASGVPLSIRRETDRKLRALKRERPDIRLVSRDNPGRDIVEAIIDFNEKKIESAGREFLIDQTERERLVQLSALRGNASLLYDDGKLIAGDIFGVHEGRAYLFVRGYDESYSKASPGLITLRHGIEHFQARRFQAVHLGWGDNLYKTRFGGERMPLSTVIVRRNLIAWTSGNLLREVRRCGTLEAKRRIKEHPRVYRALGRALEWRHSVKNRLRNDG